ncbi:DUF927 domain-containing protein [Sphingomonas sp. RB3P16]|uniref:DUF927 domain-containing protein n=1 Tax=Parasphingomonas frigoris TaxID=3096163 RepID=UPI002FC63B8B
MMALADPFAPIAETDTAPATKHVAKAQKVPIVPVPDDAPPCTFKIPGKGGAPTQKWEYRDAAGCLLGYDARFEYLEDGKRCKDVMPVTFCQEGDKQAWRSKGLPAPRPLYGLDRLAQRPDAPVVVAEGAKSADAAGSLLPDHVAVSWQGGANAISQSHWRTLAGRDVLIWPDRDRQLDVFGQERAYEDQPGTIAAENIIEKLKGHAASIRILDLRELECSDGWDAADAVVEGWDVERASHFVQVHSTLIDTDAPGTIMPFGFENTPEGLFYTEGETRRLWICGRLKVLAKTRDVAGTSWGLLLEWNDSDGVQHRWAMPKGMLAGDGSAIREELLSRGFDVSTDSRAKGRLLEFLARVDTPSRSRAVTRVGWSNGVFALPHLTFGDTAADRVLFQSTDAAAHQYASAGTLEEWQTHVALPAIGNSRLVFMVSAAFVGPILGPATEEGGGVNFVGASSSGKTTALKAAASVWGPSAFMRTWKATGNGLEGVAVQHSETLLCLDELGQLEPKEAGQVAYMLANGQGKTRATRAGGSRSAASWRIMYLSTGEVGLADLAREAKASRAPQAGQEVRILDVPADAGRGMGVFERISGAETPEAFARMIKSAAAEFYGTAALAYLEEVTALRDQVGDIIAASVAEFGSTYVPDGADGQVERGARRFGLVAAAGELAIALGILPWPKGEATGAAAVMFKSWIRRRGGTGAAEDRNIIERLRLFIEAHGDSRFAPMIEPEDGFHRQILNRAGFYRNAVDQRGDDARTVREYLFMTETWKEVFAGHDITRVNNVLVDQGILVPGASKRSQSINLPGLPKTRCYVVNAGALGDGD